MSATQSLLPTKLSLRRSTGWIGVDVGSSAIKIVQLERHRGQLRIARSLILPAPEGRVFDRKAIEDEVVSREISRGLAVHGGFVGKVAACVVSMEHCELRTLVSAKGTEEEQREMISLELSNDASGSREPREFDFWDGAMNERQDSKGMTQVHVLSMPRSLADSVGTTLLDAGLTCEVLDTVPFCMLRGLELNSSTHDSGMSPSPFQLVLDWGWSASTVSIVYEGMPVMSRCLGQCGLSRWVEPLAQRLRLSRSQTHTLLATYGVAKEKSAANVSELRTLVLETASSLLMEVTREITDTIEFAKLQLGDPLQASLTLCGGGGAIPGIDSHLATVLRRPVHAWQMPLASPDATQIAPLLSNAASLSALAWEL